MSAGRFRLSYPARTQISLLEQSDKAALIALFEGDATERPGVTQRIADGRFVSRVGQKRVLWHRTDSEEPEILSIVDRSYATKAR